MPKAPRTAILRANDTDLSALAEMIDSGVLPLCPVCKSPVVVVDTEQKMRENHSSRGAWCPVDNRHFSFYLAERRKLGRTASTVEADLEHINQEHSMREASEQLTDSWKAAGLGPDTVAPILRFMERHPDWDFGMPGDFVRYVERFYKQGYEDELVESLRRRPTRHTVWMLNRIINGEKDATRKLSYLKVLSDLAADFRHGASVTDLASELLSMHRE